VDHTLFWESPVSRPAQLALPHSRHRGALRRDQRHADPIPRYPPRAPIRRHRGPPAMKGSAPKSKQIQRGLGLGV
jgi:hypothetical protein